jgi:dynein heavy chain
MIESNTKIGCLQASGNVAGLCNWAEAMCTYHEVAKVVEPKIEALRVAENELNSATKQKDAAVDELSVVQAKLDAMQVHCRNVQLMLCRNVQLETLLGMIREV